MDIRKGLSKIQKRANGEEKNIPNSDQFLSENICTHHFTLTKIDQKPNENKIASKRYYKESFYIFS